jgi:hypothetical protein
MVATARELAHDPLKIVRTRDPEEVPPACQEVVHVAAESALTGSSSMRACVVAVEGRAPFLAHVARVLDKVIAMGRSQ